MTLQLEHLIPLAATGSVSPRPVAFTSVQGTLDLGLDPRDELVAGPLPALPVPVELLPVDAPDVEALSRAFARVLVEVLSGDRGPSQLVRWTTPEVYDQLQRRAALLHRTTPADRRLRRLRSQIRSIHLDRPRPGAVELAIHLRRGHRSLAVAARLEQRAERRRGELRVAWLCTALELG